MSYTHAPYISPYGPPEESGIRPPDGCNGEPATQANPVGPQYNGPGPSSSYAYRSSSRPNPFSSIGISSGTEDRGVDQQLKYPIPEHDADAWLQNDGDLGGWTYDSQPYGEPSSCNANNQQHAPYIHLSELELSSGNEPQGLHAFDEFWTDQYSAPGIDNSLNITAPAVEYRQWGQRRNAPLQVYCINCRTPLPIFGIRCHECEHRRKNDPHALPLEFCLKCAADVNDPGNLMCPDHMNTRQAFDDYEKAILRENHVCKNCYKRDAGSLMRCGVCYGQVHNPRHRFRQQGLCRCGRELMPGYGQCRRCSDQSRAAERRRRREAET